MPDTARRQVVEVGEAPASARSFLAVPSDTRLSVARMAAGRTALALAWAGSAALIVALLAAGYAFRLPIMQAWPASTRLYAALGLW